VTRAILAGIGLIAACAGIARLANLVESTTSFLLLFGVAFVCYAAAGWSLGSVRGGGPVTVVVAIGIMARFVLLPTSPSLSTDVYRYVWDARVAHAGINPYAYAPVDKALEPLRDTELFPRLNHPTWRTIYPPGAEAFFRIVYAASPDSVLAMKLAVALAELVGLSMIVGLLRSADGWPWRVLIYAWNPLLLVEVWGMGHLDGVLVPIVVGAMWAVIRGRHGLAGALLGVGVLFKLYPAALVSLLPIGAWPTALATFASVIALGYAPGLAAGIGVLGSLPRYLREEYFNPGLVRGVIDVPLVTMAAAAAWMMVVGAVRRGAPLAERAVCLLGGLLLLSPNIFPWYLIWLVPFLAFTASLPWIAFTGTVVFAYAFFLRQPWAVPAWARALEFAPLVLGGLCWLITRLSAPRRLPERAT
jgi:alpha-1,6-mannosyltransferase